MSDTYVILKTKDYEAKKIAKEKFFCKHTIDKERISLDGKNFIAHCTTDTCNCLSYVKTNDKNYLTETQTLALMQNGEWE